MIILAPHIEIKCQGIVGGTGGEMTFGTHWEKVQNTSHKTGNVKSENARRAHKLLASDPDKYREEGDEKGEQCYPVHGVGPGTLLFSPKEKG